MKFFEKHFNKPGQPKPEKSSDEKDASDFFNKEHFDRIKMEDEAERDGKLIHLKKKRIKKEEAQNEQQEKSKQEESKTGKAGVIDFDEKRDERAGFNPGTHELMREAKELAEKADKEEIETQGTEWVDEKKKE